MKSPIIRISAFLFVIIASFGAATFISALETTSTTTVTTTASATSTTATTSFCVAINRTLRLGMRGNDVLALQTALSADPDLYTGPLTGYFGIMTKQAVVKLQKKYNITNDPTGLGIVGPRTRAFLRSGCGPTTGGNESSDHPGSIGGDRDEHGCLTPAGYSWDATSQSCKRPWEKDNNNEPRATTTVADPGSNPQCKAWYDGCNNCSRQTPGAPAMCTMRACIWNNQAEARCTEYFASSTTTSLNVSLSGPSTLLVNQMGTWMLKLSGKWIRPTYAVSWGVATTTDAEAGIWDLANNGQSIIGNLALLLHTYKKAGTYTITATVTDEGSTSAIKPQQQVSTTVSITDLLGTTTDPIMCTQQAIQCPTGFHRQIGPGCAQSCIADATSTDPIICPAYVIQCPAGFHRQTGPGCAQSCVADTPSTTGGNSSTSSCQIRNSIAFVCPTGKHLVMGPNCERTCVDDAPSLTTCIENQTQYVKCSPYSMCIVDPGWKKCVNGTWIPLSNDAQLNSDPTCIKPTQVPGSPCMTYCAGNDIAHQYRCSRGGPIGGVDWSSIPSCIGSYSCVAQ